MKPLHPYSMIFFFCSSFSLICNIILLQNLSCWLFTLEFGLTQKRVLYFGSNWHMRVYPESWPQHHKYSQFLQEVLLQNAGNKGHTSRRGGSKIIHGGTISFVMSRRWKASWSGRNPVLLVLSLPLVQLLCSYNWLVYKHTGWGFCLMCYTYTLKCVWTLDWLSECLDSVHLCFVRLTENYVGFTLLFTNLTKRWKT